MSTVSKILSEGDFFSLESSTIADTIYGNETGACKTYILMSISLRKFRFKSIFSENRPKFQIDVLKREQQ